MVLLLCRAPLLIDKGDSVSGEKTLSELGERIELGEVILLRLLFLRLPLDEMVELLHCPSGDIRFGSH